MVVEFGDCTFWRLKIKLPAIGSLKTGRRETIFLFAAHELLTSKWKSGKVNIINQNAVMQRRTGTSSLTIRINLKLPALFFI